MTPIALRSRVVTLLALMSLITGCTVGPDYRRPTVPLPDRFANAALAALPATRQAATREAVDLSRYWAEFGDPTLNELVKRAYDANLDLRLAESRIREARAQRRVAAAGLWPGVDASGAYSRQHTSESGFGAGRGGIGGAAVNSVPGGSGGAGGAGGSGGASGSPFFAPQREFNTFQLGFDASWELDLFGGVRRGVEAADADLASAIEDRRSVLVTLVGDVARNYIGYRGFQRQAALARDNVKAARDNLELTRAQFRAGQKTYLDVARAQAQVSSTEAGVPPLETSAKQSLYQLGVLLGDAPASLEYALRRPAPIPFVARAIPAGLPSELLRRRPDIRQAERSLAAATARIGVATADLFPKFSLTGSVGQQSLELKDLASGGATIWLIGPGVTWPLFAGGRIRANIRITEAQQEQAYLTYRKQVLIGLQDVEIALAAYGNDLSRRDALDRAASASRDAYGLAQQQYNQGLIDFLVVLDAQRSLFAAEDQLAQSEAAVSTDLVALFKALGGGWEWEAPPANR